MMSYALNDVYPEICDITKKLAGMEFEKKIELGNYSLLVREIATELFDKLDCYNSNGVASCASIRAAWNKIPKRMKFPKLTYSLLGQITDSNGVNYAHEDSISPLLKKNSENLEYPDNLLEIRCDFSDLVKDMSFDECETMWNLSREFLNLGNHEDYKFGDLNSKSIASGLYLAALGASEKVYDFADECEMLSKNTGMTYKSIKDAYTIFNKKDIADMELSSSPSGKPVYIDLNKAANSKSGDNAGPDSGDNNVKNTPESDAVDALFANLFK